MKIPTSLKRNPYAIARFVKGEMLILDPIGGELHTLNSLATRIWKLLWKPRTQKYILETLEKEYEVKKIQLKKDLEAFVKKSLKSKLLLVGK